MSCDKVVTGRCGDGGASSSGSGGSSSSSGGSSSSSGGGSTLHWYGTCGCPVAMQPSPDAGPPTNDAGVTCPSIGSGCSVSGQLCGEALCGSAQICAAQDPTKFPPGCPISRRKYKDGIEYVDGAGLQELHDETIGLRLATYNYKPQVDDPKPKHLGFIIDDTPPHSPAVDWSRDRVDIYGYLSMVVATMQVQEKEIGELRRELDLARARETVCGAPTRGETAHATTQASF